MVKGAAANECGHHEKPTEVSKSHTSGLTLTLKLCAFVDAETPTIIIKYSECVNVFICICLLYCIYRRYSILRNRLVVNSI
jgi:hypothetical protein